jgi:hypothetical protein
LNVEPLSTLALIKQVYGSSATPDRRRRDALDMVLIGVRSALRESQLDGRRYIDDGCADSHQFV